MKDDNGNSKPLVLRGDIKILVDKVHAEGHGVILLTGPSSCGKGEIAKSLCKFLSLSKERHLSMGSILRKTIEMARESSNYRNNLAKDYCIDSNISVFDNSKSSNDIVTKAENYKSELISFFKDSAGFISQLDWLEFCVTQGLLIPDEWTQNIIDALFNNSPDLQKGILILDGYPRTTQAAKFLLGTLSKLNIPIIKILHLSITKDEMKARAYGRCRMDDTEECLERRYQFYIDRVQPCIDYLKLCLGPSSVALIDAHQPVFNDDGTLNVDASIHEVTLSVLQALGLPDFLLDINN